MWLNDVGRHEEGGYGTRVGRERMRSRGSRDRTGRQSSRNRRQSDDDRSQPG